MIKNERREVRLQKKIERKELMKEDERNKESFRVSHSGLTY
jgi:hypothetical protein